MSALSPPAAPAPTAHFDHKIGARVHTVLPGGHLVITEPGTAVGTLLGSCVAACLRDARLGIGGLNHFLLPGDDCSTSARYGVYAMEVLINEILRHGGARRDLEAKVFGGGDMIATTSAASIGTQNAAFVRRYLSGEGVRIAAEDLGGVRARRVFFFPDTGRARVQYLDATESRDALAGESRYASRLRARPPSGGVELF